MRLTEAQYQEILARSNRNKLRDPVAADAVDAELPLHAEIMRWCRDQVPQIPYKHTRPDKRSGDTIGSCDFVIWINRHVLAFECKDREGKRSKEQTIWAFLMEKQGFQVPIVRSMREFHELIYSATKPVDDLPASANAASDPDVTHCT